MLWGLYTDLVRGCGSGLGGRELTWPGLEAWMRVRKVQLTQYDIDLLFELDTVQAKDHEAHD